MRLIATSGIVALFVVSMGVTGVAQWLKHPTPGVPRLANGGVNPDAATPKAPDGRPDLSGLWTGAGSIPDPACVGKPGCIGQEPIPIQAIHIALTSGGQYATLRSGAIKLPDLLPYQPWALALVSRRSAFQQGEGSSDNGANVDPHARCLPPNYPRAWAFPQFRRILQTSDRLVVLHEFNASYRQIFTDGRPLPADPTPSWQGYSSGRWEGDTLVVQTIGFRDDLWLDLAGSPMTSAARVTERIRRPRYGHLDIEVTIDDPKAYTKPWSVRLDQSIVVDTELLDDNCLENEQSVQRMVGK
jgi:hypothetical protein